MSAAVNNDEHNDRAEQPRFGPMIWVPELRTRGDDDPWAHRKGEPRYFALLWTVYLLFSALLTVFSIRSVGIPTQEQFVLGGRGMALMCALGVTPLWPMVRLSQDSPKSPLHASFVDGVILLVPTFAVIMPLSLLTGWRIEVSIALCVVIAVWACVSGGVVAIGLRREGRAWRLSWMALSWAMALAGPAIAWGGIAMGWWAAESSAPINASMLSPLSSVFPLTTPESGAVMTFDVDPAWWGWMCVPLVVGAGLWVCAWAMGKGSTARRG